MWCRASGYVRVKRGGTGVAEKTTGGGVKWDGGYLGQAQ